jgi:hypothetical protein
MSIIGPDVYLGGSCNPTTWRKDIAIPLLEAAGITYYNPQVDNWTPELVDIERKAKAKAGNYLFVIDSQTRAISSMIEAAGLVTLVIPEIMYLVIEDGPHVGDVIGGSVIAGPEQRDLYRGRAYLRDLASQYDVIVHESVTAAVRALIADW